MMDTGEKGLLDELILQGRLADEDDGDDQPPMEPPEEPEDPPHDPDHPRPGDPDDPGEDEPDEPDEPEKPKPDKEKCQRLRVELANAEQAAKEAAERMRKAAEDFNQKSREVEARWQEFLRAAASFGIDNIGAIVDLRKGRVPRGFTLPSEVSEALASYRKAFQEATKALEKQKTTQEEFNAKEAEVQAVREKIKSEGCI